VRARAANGVCDKATATEASVASTAALSGTASVVLQLQRRYGNRAVARLVARRAGVSGGRRLQRLRFNLGAVSVDVDYGGLTSVSDTATEIDTRYPAFTGSAIPHSVRSSVAGLSADARRWLLYGLSILQRNVAAAPGLDRVAAVARLIARAPAATTSPIAPGLSFENEVLRVSGWAEAALPAPLHAPAGATLTSIRQLYNPPSSVGTASAPLDSTVLTSELPPALLARLTMLDPGNWTHVGHVGLGTLQTIGDEIQREARGLFAPYSDTAMSSPYASGWQYSGHLSSVTAMVPDRDQRIGYLLNRAEIVGREPAAGGSIFERANFESGRDAPALLALVTPMEADPATAAMVDRLIQHTGRTQHAPLQVGISTEWDLGALTECAMRWRHVMTLSHELCHALVHPNFPARAPSVRFGQIIREGFTEVLGIQLYRHLRQTAAGDPAFKARMEAGVAAAPCAAPPLGTIGYGQAGANAETIRSTVGDDNFRAAYFLGAVNLVGL
jgi:hypothetical protein